MKGRPDGYDAASPEDDARPASADGLAGVQAGKRLHFGKDLIYSGWDSAGAPAPAGFSIAFRELLAVDIIDRVLPYAANDQAPVVLVSTRADEHFAIDRRGSLVRVPGRPKSLGAGRRLAMKRIKAAAKTMGGELLAGNRHVPWGAAGMEPEVAAIETIVRFG